MNLSFTSNNESNTNSNINNVTESNKSNEKDTDFNFDKLKRHTINFVNEKFNLFLGNKTKSFFDTKENKEIKENKENKEKKEIKEKKENKEADTKGIFDGIRKNEGFEKRASTSFLQVFVLLGIHRV